MAKSVKKTDSATVVSMRKTGRIGNQKQNKKKANIKGVQSKFNQYKKRLLIIIIEIIINILLYWVLQMIINYAQNSNCKSVILNYVADSLTQFFLCDIVISTIVTVFKSVRAKKVELYWWFCAAFGGMILVLLALCVMGHIKVEAAISEVKETQVRENSVVIKNDSLLAGNETLIVTIEDIHYNIDDDPYMDRILWQIYCDESDEENLYVVKAKVLYNNLEENKPKGNPSQNYNNFLETADGQYETYLFQKEYAEERGDENDILFSDRIDDLQRSLDNRESADKEFKNPTNERCLAAGYKDKGDEYFGKNSQNEAITAYEKSAEWCMKSICHAAAIKDYKEVQTCITLFRKVNKEAGKLNEISQTRIERISGMLEIYEFFCDMVTNDQNAN